jgi:hypothetical protein
MTQKKYLHFEDEVEIKSTRRLKHSRNQKGKGMKVLNSYVEEDYDDENLDYDFDIDEDNHTNTK